MSELSPTIGPPVGSAGAKRSRVLAWAMWDFGATAINAIVITFVFTVYLTSTVGDDLPGETSPASWLGRALAVAGLVVALLAPVTGVWVDAPARRRRALAILTGLVVMLTASMSLIRDDHRYLWPGLILLACTAACGELSTVPYNAMLRDLSTPQTSGRVSGFGLALGYFGSVLALLVVYVGFIAGAGDTRGLLHLPVADGQNVRAAMLLVAAWFAVFALPLLISPPPVLAQTPPPRVGFIGAYRRLWHDLRAEWRRDRNLVYYLGASAIFRDGLTGVFTFGAVLGVQVYGVSSADVLLFGVAACVVAAVGSVIGGRLDDRVGSKHVIVVSLVSMIVVGLVLMVLSGVLAFWVCGLLLC
ncbi:MFS transporter, partial [Mycolicibacterium sp.]